MYGLGYNRPGVGPAWGGTGLLLTTFVYLTLSTLLRFGACNCEKLVTETTGSYAPLCMWLELTL